MKIYLIFSIIIFTVFACGGAKGLDENATSESLALGKEKYNIYCAACHGSDGQLNINGAKDLTKYIGSKKRRVKFINEGKGLMPPFKDILTTEEIEAIAIYTFQFRKNKK